MGKCGDFLVRIRSVGQSQSRSRAFQSANWQSCMETKLGVRCHPCERTFAVNHDLVAMPRRKRKRGNVGTFHTDAQTVADLWKGVSSILGMRCRSVIYKPLTSGRNGPTCSSLLGHPAKSYRQRTCPRATKRHGGKLVVMNIGETGVDDICDLRFRCERVGELLHALLHRLL